MKPYERIIFDIDSGDMKESIFLANKLYNQVGLLKIGYVTIFSAMRSMFLSNYKNSLFDCLVDIGCLAKKIGKKLFLDSRINDSVCKTDEISQNISLLNPKAFSVHELSQPGSFEITIINKADSKVFGLSASTYMGKDECFLNFSTSPDVHILYFADKMTKLGANGVVCSLEQGRILRSQNLFDGLKIICPFSIKDCYLSPREAIRTGIDYLIVNQETIKSIGDIQKFAKEIALGINDKKLSKKVS